MNRRLGLLTKFFIVVIALAACGGSKGSSSQSGPVATELQTSINGWSFPNFPASAFPKTDFNEADLVSMFGSGDEICMGAVATPCKLTAEAAAWARMVNQSRASGHCEGLVAIASTRFNNKETPETVKIPSQDETIHALMRAFATQFLPEVQDAISMWINKSLEVKIDELKNSFVTGSLNYTLGLYTEGGGHALLPYAVEYPTPTTPRILLYDSNWPGKNRYVDVDLKAKTWRFSFSGEDPANDPDAWTGGPQDMDLTPLSARTGTCPFCGDGTKVAKTTMLIRSNNLDWSVETNGGVVSPESPVGTDGASVLPVKGSVERDSYDYFVSVPTSSDSTSATDVTKKRTTSKLKFSGSTSVYAMMPDGIAQFTTSGKSDNPVEIEGSSISTKDPAVDLTLASGNLVANASGAAISLSVSGGEMAVSVTTASGQVVQQQVSEDKPTLQMKADPTGGGITVLAASSTGVVEKTAVSSTGVETKTIVKEVLNLSAVKAELPPELASKEIAALPSLANRNMANPNYKVDPVYVAPTTTAPKENSGNVSSKGAPQEPTVGRLILPSVEFGDVPFTVQAPTSNSKGEWRFSSNKPDVAQVTATGRVTIMGAGSATITATQAATKDYESISVTADLTVARATPILGVFSTTTRTVGEEAFTLANPTSTSSAAFKLESSDESVAKFSKVNGKLSIVGAGRTTITASQPANDDYLAASKNFVLTVRKGTPVLTATADLSATFGQDGPTIAKPTSESRGAISFASSNLPVATVNATTGKLTIASAGTTTITVTQAATDDYVSATQTLTFTVGKAQPTLGALSVESKTFGDASFSITKPTSVSSGAFTFTSSNSSVVKISEAGTASIEGAGTATITATQAAAGNYSSYSVTADITVAKGAPQLSNISLTGLVFGDADVTMQPRSTSTGAFTFSTNNARVLTVNETTGRVRVVSAGTATITVRQASTTNYEAASSSVTVQVGLATPAFQRLDPITKQAGDSTFLFNWGTSPSDGAITYESSRPEFATIHPTTGRVTIVGVGVTTLTMRQSQGTNHTAANIVVVLTVERGTPVYGDFVIPTKTLGTADFLLTRPTTTSSGTFSFTSSNTSVATIDPSTGLITLVGAGSTTVTASQLATTTHTSASISTTLTVQSTVITKLSLAYHNSCGLTNTGAMKCWGYNGWGQIGTLAAGVQTTPSNLPGYTSNVSAIAAGHHHTCVLTTAGAVSCFGYSWNNNLSPGINSGAVDISAGYLHTCALMSYGGVKCWGRNDSGGQLGDGTNTNRVAAVDVLGLTSGVTAITTGMEFSCALLNTGAVKCWGYNGYGQIGDGTNTNRNVPTQVSGIESEAVAIVGGNNHACALLATGAVKCWGANYYGQIGDATTSNRLTPVTITSLGTSVRSISAGWEHTCAVTRSGAAKCWGRNSEGSLGDGTFTHRNAPVEVDGLDSGVLAINADKSLTTCATVSGNNVKCWGYNAWGNVGDASTDSRSSPVDVIGLPSGTAENTTLGALTLPSSSYTTSSADFTLTAPTSSRAGTFSYASSNPEVVTVNAETGVVHIEGIGTAVLGASIGGNGQYRATSAQVTITVGFSCANGGLCSIGDTGPGGGVVFYDAGSNQSWGRYLEFAPSTSQVSRTWSTGANQQITVTGADGTAIGTGLENTTLIAAQSGNLAASSAASYAASYSNNNKSDWFVPSKAELNELCKYARNTGQAAGSSTRCSGGSAPTLRGFTADWHWSSSQSGNNGALDQNFYDGDQGGDGKDWTGIVRPVRAITPLTDCQLAIACAVGDLGPAGGRIIYVNPTSSNAYDFVEAAPTDIAPTLWCAGPKANTVIGHNSAYRDINSVLIVSNVQLRNCTSGAGTSAQNYSANGLSGWQIPNYSLVDLMRTALFNNGLGSFISTDYLTANEQDASSYVAVSMTNGGLSYPGKSTATRLRPVRFFAKADRSKKTPTLSLSVPATSYAYGAADFYTSASSTGLNDFGGSFTSRGSISYASSNTAVATVDSYTGLVSIVGSGSFTITATQSAWGIFKAPTSVSTNFSVANGTPQFSGFAIPGSGYRADDGSFNTTNATSSSSSGAITYTSSNTAVATINATTGRVTLVAAGTTTLTATLAPNGFWNGATLTVPLSVGALCADGGECRMGDIGPGGGRIFLLPTSTGNTTNKYFEAAPSDLPTALEWCNDTTTSITGANGTALGTGEANTTAIDAACTSGAAQGAADYTNNSIGDWYLPSLDELTAMLGSRTTIGGFASASYWSSSEENGEFAKRLGFPDGGMSGHVKSQLFQVRPIRSFEIRRSCLDIKTATGTNTNGTYTIALNVSGSIINTQVYCLMDSAISGGGWTLTMKAPRNSTTFPYSANYWTTANTLNVGNTSNVTSDATSAKFNTFNYLSGTEMLAIFPDAGINGGSLTGHTYGWTWKQTIPSGPKTPLEIFSGPAQQFISDALNFGGYDTRIWTRQADIRFYGFNWDDNHRARWGFGWNENGGGLWPNGYRGSDDATGGIGLAWGNYSAGDGSFCCTLSTGLNRSMSFETYIR